MSKGSLIKQLRENLGYSQTDFAKLIHVSKQSLYKYENDIITNIPSDKIELIAKLCNVTPCYIMGWEDDLNGMRPLPAAADPFYTKYEMLDDADREFVSRTVDGLLASEKYRTKKDMHA